METFDCDEILSALLVLIWVSENNSGKRCSTTWIMYNFLYDSLDVPTYDRISLNVNSMVLSYPSLSAKSRVLN